MSKEVFSDLLIGYDRLSFDLIIAYASFINMLEQQSVLVLPKGLIKKDFFIWNKLGLGVFSYLIGCGP